MSAMTPMGRDVLIVGGGSAGAVLAARLSADPGLRVTLLEAGPAYPPGGTPPEVLNADSQADPGHDWGYTMYASPERGHTHALRGRVLGGSSAVNFGIAQRARPSDFAAWSRHGVTGWGWNEVLPYYKKLESDQVGGSDVHGRTGPTPIHHRAYLEMSISMRAFVDAAVAEGYPPLGDLNGIHGGGVAGHPVNIVDGIRQNTALTYLTEEVRERPNLQIIGDVTVDRLLLDGARALGVVTVDGAEYRATLTVLSAGAYGSPAILMRSGIGPAAHLAELGIDVVADLPVGSALRDHPMHVAVHALNPEAAGMRPLVGAMLWTASSGAAPGELDLHIGAMHPLEAPFSPTGAALAISTALVCPQSTGTLRLASRDPLEAPLIHTNFLATESDRARMLEAVKIGRRIARSSPLDKLITAELMPGAAVDDDEQLAAAIAVSVESYAHPTSTAPMGDDDDPAAVVDSMARVKGIEALHVIDASIFPDIPSTAINLTVIMVAERLADLLVR